MNYFDGLQFRVFGDLHSYSGESLNKRFDGYYGIQYTHSGRLYFSMNGAPQQIFDGPCAFISFPGAAFNYGPPPGELRDHCFICFGGSRVKEYIRSGLLCLRTENAVISIRKAERFYSTMRELQKILSYPGGRQQPRAVLMLEDLLLQLQEQESAPSSINAFCEQHIRRLRDEIVNAPVRCWDFAAEAQTLSVSYSHFRRLFREITGYAPNQFLIECRLNFASGLIINSTAPLSEIAHASGFEDEFYFSRIFKLHRHITPSAYRREFRL